MSILRILCYNGSLATWTVVALTTANFKPLIFYIWLRPVLHREHVHSHDFVWLLLVAWTIFLYSRIHREGWNPCANCGPVWTLENFQRCGEPCFLGAAILRRNIYIICPVGSSYRLGSHLTENTSLPSNGSLVKRRSGAFTVPLPSNGWCLLLDYSAISQYVK
jgi:hypothetical protein